MILEGNIITEEKSFYGTLEHEGGKITKITPLGEKKDHADLILAGFIDVHFHGMGPCDAEDPESLNGIRKYAVEKGITSIAPSLSSMPFDETILWLKKVASIVKSGQQDGGAVIAGAHLEGPWLSYPFRGGMREDYLRKPTMEDAEAYLKAADGTLKIVTLSPELPGGKEMVRFLKKQGITVSLGHSACPPELFPEMVDAGISQVCHIFDAYDVPGHKGGIRLPAVTDMALIDDRVLVELIVDGLHVPPPLIQLVRKAAGPDRVVGITASLQGAGLPEGRFISEGRWYVIRDGDVGRLEETGGIVGSSLTMNRAYFNLTEKFSFTEQEATKAVSANPAKSLGIRDRTGSLQEGLDADIAVLSGEDRLTVKKTILKGRVVYGKRA
ncbi:MAG: amidohydrolase family protein [Lentisphaeria bacterium]|nr:amidohydrolase family protein [Lentisphaeria bacterium]